MPRTKTVPTGWKGTAHRPATPNQIAKIHTLKSVLGMAEEDYRIAIARHGQGVTSSKDLTRAEATRLINELDAKAQARPEKVTSQGNVIALATIPQKALIGHLVDEVDWYTHGGFTGWLRTQMRIEEVITKEDASRVIEGLKGLKRHGHHR